MRAIVLVAVALVLVAAIHESEGLVGKRKQECKDEEVDEDDQADVQAIEDCIQKKAKDTSTKKQLEKIATECGKKVTTASGGCHGKSKFGKEIMGKLSGLLGGLKDAGKDGGKGLMDKLIKGLDKVKDGAKGLMDKFMPKK